MRPEKSVMASASRPCSPRARVACARISTMVRMFCIMMWLKAGWLLLWWCSFCFFAGLAAIPGSLLRAVGGLGLDIAHIVRQVFVPEHLAHGLDLPKVIPVMVADAPHGRANALPDGFAVAQQVALQAFGGQGIEIRVGGLRDGVPDLE